MRLLAVGSGSFLLALSGAVMPGPLLAVTVAYVSRRGLSSVFWAVGAHGLCELVVLLGLRSGLGPLMGREAAVICISFVGAIALGWMAVGALRQSGRGEAVFYPSGPAQTAFLAPFGAGAAATLLNPYWLVWWATIATAYLAQLRVARGADLGAFFVAHIGGDLAWYLFVGAVVHLGRSRLPALFHRRLLQVCGIFLFAMALYFVFSGLKAAI